MHGSAFARTCTKKEEEMDTVHDKDKTTAALEGRQGRERGGVFMRVNATNGSFHHVQIEVGCILKVYSEGKDTSIGMSHAVSCCTRKAVLKISLHAKLVHYAVYVIIIIIIVMILIIKFMQFSSRLRETEPNPNTDIHSSACSNCCLVSGT